MGMAYLHSRHHGRSRIKTSILLKGPSGLFLWSKEKEQESKSEEVVPHLCYHRANTGKAKNYHNSSRNPRFISNPIQHLENHTIYKRNSKQEFHQQRILKCNIDLLIYKSHIHILLPPHSSNRHS